MAITSGNVKVDNSELQSKAELAYLRIADCSAALDRIDKSIGSSDSYWQGEAGDAARTACSVVVKEARAALDELKEYPKELLEYRELYSEVIAQTTREASDIEEYTLV